MSVIGVPVQTHHFQVIIEGFPSFDVQELQLPEVTIEATEHGSGVATTTKHAGLRKVGNLTLKTLRRNLPQDAIFWGWLEQTQSTSFGSTNPKRNVLIRELTPDQRVGKQWRLIGVFPIKHNLTSFNRTSSDNVMTEMEFSVDDMFV